MGAWVETASPNFAARHDILDEEDVVGVLELLEGTRERLAGAFPTVPGEVEVVIHGTRSQLYAAQPEVLLLNRLTAPAARRYLTGWAASGRVHMLAPRHLRARASNVPGSREMAMLAPAALYAQLVIGANNPQLPPPFRPRSFARMPRWGWLWAGAGQWFSGQTAYARPAIARRLHEGREPRFPPGLRDALLLGGSVIDLLAREEGEEAAVRLACQLPASGARRGLVEAFNGRPFVHTEGTWRAHLAKLAGT